MKGFSDRAVVAGVVAMTFAIAGGIWLPPMVQPAYFIGLAVGLVVVFVVLVVEDLA